MRDVLTYVSLVINVVSLFGLIAGILLHSGRGGGLSDMFGGGGLGDLFDAFFGQQGGGFGGRGGPAGPPRGQDLEVVAITQVHADFVGRYGATARVTLDQEQVIEADVDRVRIIVFLDERCVQCVTVIRFLWQCCMMFNVNNKNKPKVAAAVHKVTLWLFASLAFLSCRPMQTILTRIQSLWHLQRLILVVMRS